jgi:hypothetical protein
MLQQTTAIVRVTQSQESFMINEESAGGKRERIRVEAQIWNSQLAEYELLMLELFAGKRTRAELLERERALICERAITALQVIVTAIESHPGTGQVGRLVRFLAGLYNGSDYPFDLSDLRALDTRLANACLDYLNYDRLGISDLDKHVEGGGRRLLAWFEEYGIERIRP